MELTSSKMRNHDNGDDMTSWWEINAYYHFSY